MTLSDIAPSRGARERFAQTRSFTYLSEPLSALSPPGAEHGIWTVFTGLRHFSPPEVTEIMRSAQSRKVTFCAFEATSRSGRGIAVTLLVPILVLLLMPRVRPRRALPLLLTYLPPILPVLIWWDALASTMRTYTVDELEALARDSSTETYEWRVRQLPAPGAPIPVLSLVGRPVEPV